MVQDSWMVRKQQLLKGFLKDQRKAQWEPKHGNQSQRKSNGSKIQMFNSEVDFCWNQFHQKVVDSRLQNLPGTHFSQMSAIGLHIEVAGIHFMDYDIQ